jgi:hypothetical protein
MPSAGFGALPLDLLFFGAGVIAKRNKWLEVCGARRRR